ncbi:AraC family transcriptional regulator [Marinomonas pollencensis]|uniref:AraC family transcriptional regulator n=1 Tax=Marinomonas pollencensis TaxID=491954 RepID=A0A3E0DPS9_9GAMM|nr:AraC family transcriptional regulator [Marinomonas pollencensis]REG83855.1 AraC family transcriptional regulator [Marinomonas pollencensis]
MAQQNRLTRIEKVLDYIHDNLDEPIHVANLAEKSCWSRWQFQRVFGEATGLTVAQYIRELRLSKAAELLLSSTGRQMDVAMQCGFDSEISFSRAFKQMFGCTPRAYRQRGKRQGLRTPLHYRTDNGLSVNQSKAFTQVRIENHEPLCLYGMHDWIRGPFSSAPNFLERVPKLWSKVEKHAAAIKSKKPIGIIDTHYNAQHPEQMQYWAGYLDEQLEGQEQILVPAQEYAVIPVYGPVTEVEKAVGWFLHHWLPDSHYYSVSGYELERYSPNYEPNSVHSYMEYWLPIQPR